QKASGEPARMGLEGFHHLFGGKLANLDLSQVAGHDYRSVVEREGEIGNADTFVEKRQLRLNRFFVEVPYAETAVRGAGANQLAVDAEGQAANRPRFLSGAIVDGEQLVAGGQIPTHNRRETVRIGGNPGEQILAAG